MLLASQTILPLHQLPEERGEYIRIPIEREKRKGS
jgi:hypothetical protein